MKITEGKYLSINTEELSQDVLLAIYDLVGEPEGDSPIIANLSLFKDVLKFEDIKGDVLNFFETIVWEGLKRGANLIVLK